MNEGIRSGLGMPHSGGTALTTPRDLGSARVDLTKALALAEALDEDAIGRRLAEGR